MPTIIEMVNHTRLDCVIGVGRRDARWGRRWRSTTPHRSAFGSVLVDQPLMQNVLADLAIESEAATIGAMRLARAFDEAHAGDERASSIRRLATPVLKYWTCKRAPMHAVEALECLGGNGYVEESGMPRLFRESPLASIWEGSGNVQCLDVLRAMARSPQASRRSSPRSGEGAGPSRGSTRAGAGCATSCRRLGDAREPRAAGWSSGWRSRYRPRCSSATATRRSPTRSAPRASAGDSGRAFGTLPAGTDFGRIIERHAAGV